MALSAQDSHKTRCPGGTGRARFAQDHWCYGRPRGRLPQDWRWLARVVGDPRAHQQGLQVGHDQNRCIPYRHAGTDVSTVRDTHGHNKIVVDQSYYIEALTDVEIDPDRLLSATTSTKHNIQACRSSLSAMQWVAIQSQPQVCARCNLLLRPNHRWHDGHRERNPAGRFGGEEQDLRLMLQKFVNALWHWRKDVVFISMEGQAHALRALEATPLGV